MPATAHIMRCPHCYSSDLTQVINTHHRLDGATRRRHGCRRCQIRWTGVELIEPNTIKADVVRPSVKPPALKAQPESAA